MSIFDNVNTTNKIQREGSYCVWMECYIECVNGRWGIYWPDCTKAWDQTFATKGWATRTLNWLIKRDKE